MITNPTINFTRLARGATYCPHWRWLDGMKWYTADPSNEWNILDEGLVGLKDAPSGAIPDFTHDETVAILADRVRYLWDLPDLASVYEDRTGLYKVTLPNGASVARYSSAGAWVGMLELYSYRTEIQNFGRSR